MGFGAGGVLDCFSKVIFGGPGKQRAARESWLTFSRDIKSEDDEVEIGGVRVGRGARVKERGREESEGEHLTLIRSSEKVVSLGTYCVV